MHPFRYFVRVTLTTAPYHLWVRVRAFALVLWHEGRLVNPLRLTDRDYFRYGVR